MYSKLLQIAGHRGMGCTDSLYARRRTDSFTRPAENTLESFGMALRMADVIEADVILTRDNHPVIIHSATLSEHIQPTFWPAGMPQLDQMTLAEALSLKLGMDGQARIPTLQQLLMRILQLRPGNDLVLNLELKACENGYELAQRVLADIAALRFPLQRISFSSFVQEGLVEIAAIAPQARIGMLFGEHDFTVPTLERTLDMLPRLESLHPEIRTLTEETVAFAAGKKLCIATWAWEEASPLQNSVSGDAARGAISLCSKHRVPLMLITDYIEDMRKVIVEFRSLPQ